MVRNWLRRVSRALDDATEITLRAGSPSYDLVCGRAAALAAEGEQIRAALAGELPDDHPVSRWVAFLRSQRPDIPSEWVAHSDDLAEPREGDRR